MNRWKPMLIVNKKNLISMQNTVPFYNKIDIETMIRSPSTLHLMELRIISCEPANYIIFNLREENFPPLEKIKWI